MTRTLTTATSNAIQSGQSKVVHFVLLNFYNSGTGASDPVRLVTGDTDLTADMGDGTGAVAWSKFGGKIEIDTINETGDLKAQGAEITIPAADVSILTDALSRDYVGRECKVWRGHVSGASVIADPVLLFSGTMSGGFDLSEFRGRGRAESDLTVHAISNLHLLDRVRSVQTNTRSYRRAFPSFNDDTFFDVVPDNAKKQEPWGQRSVED